MGTKTHGTYAKLFRDVWRHPKTYRLADAIARLGYPARAARREAVGQLHELLCWCVAESDEGQVGHLPASEFARIVGWDDPRRAPQLLDAWKDSGFLDVIGPGNVRVHDFVEAARDLLEKRAKRRTSEGGLGRRADAARTPHGEPTDAERTDSGAPTVHRQCADGAPAVRPRARAGSGSGNGSGRPPTEGFADAASPVGSQQPAPVAKPTAPETTAEPAGPPATTRKPRRASKALSVGSEPTAAPPRAPTVDLCKAWVEAAAAAGYPAVPINGQHARTLAGAWKAAGGDLPAVVRAVDAYFADRSDFVVRNGHAIGEFGRTSARWLAVAAGTAPAAALPLSRQASAITAAFDEAGRRLAAGATPAPEEVDRLTDALPPDVAASALSALPVTPW